MAISTNPNGSAPEPVRRPDPELTDDEYDLAAYSAALAAHRADPVTFTLDEVEKELEQP